MALSVIKESKLLAKHTAVYGFGTVLNNVVSFMLLPIYTRYLTPKDYGVKELVGLTTEVIGILVAVAISSAFYRFYFEYEKTEDRNEILSSTMITIAVIGFIAIGALSFGSKIMAKYIINDEQLYYYFLIALASMWFKSLNSIGYNYLRAHRRSGLFILLSLGRMVTVMSLNIYFIVFCNLGVLGILLSTLITASSTTLILVVPINVKIGIKFSWAKIKEMAKFGLPLIPTQFGAFIVHLSDRFFIKGYCSIADAGLYSLGYKFGAIPSNFISAPFNQVWQPRRFEIYKEPNAEETFGRIFTYFVGLIFFAGLGVSVLTKDVLILMADEKYWSAYKIVPIIVLATTIFTFHYHLNMGILIAKKTKYLAYINFSNGGLILILNFLLIPRYGVYGAAYATLIAFIYKIALTYYFSSKYYKISFESLRIAKILMSAVLIYLVCQMIHADSIYQTILIKTGSVLCFPVLLVCTGFLHENEKTKIKDIFRSIVSR